MDRFSALIRRVYAKTGTVAAVRRELRKQGLSASDTAIATWMDWHRIRGTDIRSLGLFDHEREGEGWERSFRWLRILWQPNGGQNLVNVAFGPDATGLKLIDGEPDYVGLARNLGRRRLQSFGDMDFILLALWTKEFRQMQRGGIESALGASPCSRRLFDVAGRIRSDMFAAVNSRAQSALTE